MILIRIALIGLIVYLLVRSLLRYSEADEAQPKKPDQGNNNNTSAKKVSKEIGEYVDYEELDKKKT